MAERIVVALGGNALGNTLAEQRLAVGHTAAVLAELAGAGYELAVVHGNGPQVGLIQSGMEALERSGGAEACPLHVCVAMSQGYIGFDLERALRAALGARGLPDRVATVLTQVAVNPADPAFQTPSKPIGSFMTREAAEKAAREQGFAVREDAGRGWRRVVASPRPKKIVELEQIAGLLTSGTIPIACGGGGIPVAADPAGAWQGVDAVIDKDLAASLLARELGAKKLVILTAVEKVAIGYRTPGETWLDTMTAWEAEAYLRAGEFAPGSMAPKVAAAVEFVRSGPGREALITLLDRAEEGISGRTGTRILP